MPRSSKAIFTDRYGGRYPDPKTVCKGPCEGMGVYPVPSNKPADKWKFKKCLDCGGTGKR